MRSKKEVAKLFNNGLSWLLSASLVLGLVPVPAYADVLDGEEVQDDIAIEQLQEEPADDPSEVVEVAEPTEDLSVEDEQAASAVDAAEAMEAEDPEGLSAEAAVVEEQELPVEDTSNVELELSAQADSAVTMKVDTPIDVSLGDGEYWVGKFTAPSDGDYSFFSTGDYDTFGSLYASLEDLDNDNYLVNDDQGGKSNNFGLSYSLKKNETVYLRASGYGDQAAIFAIEVIKGRLLSAFNWEGETTFVFDGNSKSPILDRVYRYADDGSEITLAEGKDYQFKEYRQGNDTLDFAPTDVGSYIAVYEGIGKYAGEYEVWFEIVEGNDLDYGKLSISQPHFANTGNPIQLEATVTDAGGNVLKEGVDYELVFRDQDWNEIDCPSTAGSYHVSARALENSKYYGETGAQSFNVVNVSDLSVNKSVHLSGDTRWYLTFVAPSDGSYTIYSEGSQDTWVDMYSDLECDDYIDYDSNSGEGDNFSLVCSLNEGQTACFVVEADEELDTTVTIVNKLGLSSCDYNNEKSYYIEGKDTFESSDISFYRYDRKTIYLEEGVDYKLIGFRDASGKTTKTVPTTAGEYDVIFEGMGDYFGKAYIPISIVDASNLAAMDYWLNTDIYAETGLPVDVDYALRDIDDNMLSQGRDYKLKFSDTEDNVLSQAPSVRGSYHVWAEAIEGSGYSGRTHDTDFTIVDAHNLAYASLNMNEHRYECTGNPVEIDVFVRDAAGNSLARDTDYVLKFRDNDGIDLSAAPSEPGEYSVKCVPSGNSSYYGESYYGYFYIVDSFDITSYSAHLLNYDVNRYDEEYIPTYLFEGKAVTPSLSVWDYETTLTDGIDYSVTYKNNTKVTTLSSPATATITGKGKYHGSITVPFMIVNSIPLESYVEDTGVTVRYGNSSSYWAGFDESAGDYLYTGGTITPTVSFLTSSKIAPKLDSDYSVSYVDASGKSVTPKDAGKYKIVMTAKGSRFTGTAEIPFSIVASKNIFDTSVSLSNDYASWQDYDSRRHEYSFQIMETLDKVGDLLLSIGDSGVSLVENLDYVVSSSIDSAKNLITLVITGKGNYTGSVTARVNTAADTQSVMNERYLVTRYVYGDRVVFLTSDGGLQTPMLSVDGLVNGIDYEVAGVLNSKGNAITTAKAGDSVFIQLKGINDYAGSERRVAATVREGTSTRSLGDSDVYAILNNGVTVLDNGSRTLQLRKSITPDVQVLVYSPNVVLRQGNGFSVTTSTSSDGKTMDIKVTADNNQFITGSTTLTVKLVDSYNLIDALSGFSIAGSDNCYGWYSISDANTVELPYYGFAFTPDIYSNSNGLTDSLPSFKTTLLDASGKTVSSGKITGAGNYTLKVTGTGDYSGAIDIPLRVYKVTTGLHVDDCQLELGEAKLVKGKAEPTVTLKSADGAATFAKGTDYTVEYGANTKVGSNAWVKITAVEGGRLTGTRAMNFVVTDGSSSKDLSTDFVLLLQVPNTTTYRPTTGYASMNAYKMSSTGGATPSVKVAAKHSSDSQLDSKYYDVTYKNNTAEGVASVTVTGKNGYGGSLSANFIVLPADDVTFIDVNAKTAHSEDIDWLAKSGISAGWVNKDGTKEFRPYANVARADMAAFLFRLAKNWGIVDDSWQPSGEASFLDVTPKTAHYREIMWLAESGISKGWDVAGGKEFRPYANVARADMAAFLSRLQGKRGQAPSLRASASASSPFLDVTPKTAHYDDILWLAESGISKGWDVAGGKEFRPYANVARADMAAFLQRMDAMG